MSTTLFFLVPIGILAVVWSLCFVGACFQTSGLASPYSDNIVTESSLVAYWPLGDLLGTLDTQGQTSIAGDLSGNHHDGTYTIPPAYPSGAQAVQFSKPIANPSLSRNPSIVAGDAGSVKNPLAASVDFEGGFVSIPWASNSPQLSDFTLEAWIKPDWTVTGFRWSVFSALAPGNTTGFVIYVNEQNQWQFFIGDGTTANTPINSMVPVPVNPGSITYVAVTFESGTGTLSLWINPQSESDLPNPPPPTPAFTTQTTYVPVDPTQLVTFFIGADANQEALRTMDGGPGAPLFPFQGQIQSVALYSTALDANTLQSHFTNGVGS
jgi:hypothetical protein